MFIHSTHYANRLELILLTLKTGVGVVGQICLQHHLSLFVMVDQNHLITLYETISAQHYLLNIFMNQDAKCKRKTAFFGTYLVRQITILWQEATAIWWRIRKRRYIIVFWHEILSATPCKLRDVICNFLVAVQNWLTEPLNIATTRIQWKAFFVIIRRRRENEISYSTQKYSKCKRFHINN